MILHFSLNHFVNDFKIQSTIEIFLSHTKEKNDKTLPLMSTEKGFIFLQYLYLKPKTTKPILCDKKSKNFCHV